MRLIKLILITSFLILVNLGCTSNKTPFLKYGDLVISAKVSTFVSVDEYHAFFGPSLYSSGEDDKEKMQDTVVVNVNWDLTQEKRLDNSKLYYAPYIIVIQPQEPFSYAGTGRYYSGIYLSTVTTSVPNEVFQDVLSQNRDYEWSEMSSKRFAWVLHPKTFGQGFASIAFIKTTDTSIKPAFKVYYVYHDPVLRKGWVKPIETE